MSRRRQAVKRPLIPDPRFNSTLVANLVNMIMERGKRTVAQKIVYTAFERVSEKLEKGDPSISMGIYATVLAILGLIDGLGNVADRGTDTLGLDIDEDRLPKKVQPRSNKSSRKEGRS